MRYKWLAIATGLVTLTAGSGISLGNSPADLVGKITAPITTYIAVFKSAGTVSAVSTVVEGSVDGTNWFTFATLTTIGVNSVSAPCPPYLRIAATSTVTGSGGTVDIYVAVQ